LDPRAAVAALDAAVPEDAIVSIGGGHFWSFPISILTARRQHHWSFALDFGSIGHGLLLGIGAATADPARSTVIVEGDASLLMNISALELVGRHQLPILIVVLNDEALGAEFHKLRAMGLPPELSAAPSPELADIARGFGVEAVTVSTLEQLRSTLQSWEGQPLPKFLDLRVSREVVSPLFMRGRNETLAVARAMREEDAV
jgi:thiamine pyrophosphate-dependent acetolactate synthase large subunit-like protein